MEVQFGIATNEPRTWIALAEVFLLGAILTSSSDLGLMGFLGLAMVAHLGWMALTSISSFTLERHTPGQDVPRRNHELRFRVTAFLNEVKRIEDYAQKARVSGAPRAEVAKNLRAAEKRIHSTADEVLRATGRVGLEA